MTARGEVSRSYSENRGEEVGEYDGDDTLSTAFSFGSFESDYGA
jgi:hypothetical protein